MLSPEELERLEILEHESLKEECLQVGYLTGVNSALEILRDYLDQLELGGTREQCGVARECVALVIDLLKE